MDFQQYHFHITGYENDTPATIQSKSPRAYLVFVKVRFSINIRRETNRTVTVRSPYDHRLGQMTVTVRFVSLWMFYANAKLFRKNIHPRKLSATFRRRRPRMAGITLNYSPDTEFGSACGVSRGPFSLISILLPNTHWTPLRAHWRIHGRLREKLIPADDVASVLKRLHYSTISC